MVVAKSEQGVQRTEAGLQVTARWRSGYHAVVQGHLDPLRGTIDAPIHRHPSITTTAGRWCSRREAQHHPLRQPSRRFPRRAWVDVGLETGRTHQIRGALLHPAAPVRGRPPRMARIPLLAARGSGMHQAVARVAWRLAFAHPADGRWMCFESLDAPDLAAALALIERPVAHGGGRKSVARAAACPRATMRTRCVELIGATWAEYPGVVLDVDAEEPWMRAPATSFDAWARHVLGAATARVAAPRRLRGGPTGPAGEGGRAQVAVRGGRGPAPGLRGPPCPPRRAVGTRMRPGSRRAVERRAVCRRAPPLRAIGLRPKRAQPGAARSVGYDRTGVRRHAWTRRTTRTLGSRQLGSSNPGAGQAVRDAATSAGHAWIAGETGGCGDRVTEILAHRILARRHRRTLGRPFAGSAFPVRGARPPKCQPTGGTRAG